jgi:RND family efflux transporter MFP subunit
VADEDLSRLRIDKSTLTANPRRKRSRWWYVAAGLIAVLIIVLLYVTGLARPAAEVQVANVTQVYPAQGITLLNASGYVVAQRKSALASKVTGRLIWLGVEEGSRVKKDQVIARLESEDVQAAREQAQANVVNVRSNLNFAKAELNDATLALNRTKELVAKGFIAQVEYDTAFARYQKAVASVAAAEAALKGSMAALEGATVGVEYTQIRAPFDAVVLTKNADMGDIVSPISGAANAKAAVVTIADMGSLQVEADVSESNLEKVKLGQPCEIQLDAFPEVRFRGELHMIVPTADRTKATVMVKTRFLDLDPRILPEMSAKVAFLSRPVTADEQKPRTSVNRAAVVKKNGRDIIYVVKGGKVLETPVRLGPAIGDMLEVIEGVKPGEKVVLSPPATLRNGSSIKVSEK